MTLPSEKLKGLYQEIADLTRPKCGQCRIPNGCCDQQYCLIAERWAKDHGIEVKRTDHPHLPFMGPKGCTLEPWIRQICAVHVCENHLWKDLKFREKYVDLRERISMMEMGFEDDLK